MAQKPDQPVDAGLVKSLPQTSDTCRGKTVPLGWRIIDGGGGRENWCRGRQIPKGRQKTRLRSRWDIRVTGQTGPRGAGTKNRDEGVSDILTMAGRTGGGIRQIDSSDEGLKLDKLGRGLGGQNRCNMDRLRCWEDVQN